MKHKPIFHIVTMLLVIFLLGACASGKPVGTPNPPGATVDVGGWRSAETTQKGYSMSIEPSGGVKKSGWQVTILNTTSTSDAIHVKLTITNTTGAPGAIDIADGPVLIDGQGNRILPAAVNAGMDDDVPVSSSASISNAVTCHMSSPNASGVQQATCTLIVVIKDGKAQLAVGAGQTAEVTFIYQTSVEKTSIVLEWLDGTLFTLP